ncbi:unnamed protein product [Spodoptera exigua]|uniref:Transmembrane inner ear expressed protein n=1 Tax=Spodoptera exigua TaxID=7107 RepID=A0A835GP38_SPOEX|nr:hypothetical protein HW555_004005 [Spodoptera exigua]KAH9639631.1 hypothetical protein HF086_010038 [Spodoptera exigua]CAH0694729.1 unnamed protein product [Spodoptera exigua]
MDPIMDIINNSEEPEWLERNVVGDLRLWQIMFLCLASVASLIVIVCCCFRFRIPRTKQQIEADYQRRKISNKFRAKLETIEDAKMDAMSLKDALDILHEQTTVNMEGENQQGSQPSSIMSPQQSSLDASFQPEGGQKPEPQASGLSFVKFASKVATISKLGQPKSPTSPTPSGNKMEF